MHMFENVGIKPEMLQAALNRNHAQKERLFEKMNGRFSGQLDGLTIAVWGLAFKPGADDLSGAPSLALIERLLAAGACVKAYDPVAMDNAHQTLPQKLLSPEGLSLTAHQYDAVAGADALALVTEWKPFRRPDFSAMKAAMKQHVIFAGRNQHDPMRVRTAGLEYFGIGR